MPVILELLRLRQVDPELALSTIGDLVSKKKIFFFLVSSDPPASASVVEQTSTVLDYFESGSSTVPDYFESGSCCVAQDGFGLIFALPQASAY